MNQTKRVTAKIAGKTKRLVGEVLGDRKLYDEGKAQEKESWKEDREDGKTKPLGNLDRLT